MTRRTKRFVSGSIGLLTGAVVSSAEAADLPAIQDVLEAGIYCSGDGGSDDIGPRFYEYVRSACVGQMSCSVNATAVASEEDLQSYGCTNFFVIAVCGPEDLQEYTSETLSESLDVFCDGP
jgi:hypothetical protein